MFFFYKTSFTLNYAYCWDFYLLCCSLHKLAFRIFLKLELFLLLFNSFYSFLCCFSFISLASFISFRMLLYSDPLSGLSALLTAALFWLLSFMYFSTVSFLNNTYLLLFVRPNMSPYSSDSTPSFSDSSASTSISLGFVDMGLIGLHLDSSAGAISYTDFWFSSRVFSCMCYSVLSELISITSLGLFLLTINSCFTPIMGRCSLCHSCWACCFLKALSSCFCWIYFKLEPFLQWLCLSLCYWIGNVLMWTIF